MHKSSPPLGRLGYWWKSLRLGTRQLNAAAGWVGTVILILGIAGVVVPLVLHQPRWLIAVILLSLLVFVVGEGGYQVWRSSTPTTMAQKQATVLELQATQLQQNALEQRQAQASLVFIELDRGSDLRVGQAEVAAGAVRGETVTAEVTNSSNRPVYEVHVLWSDESGNLLPIAINPEPLGSLMPQAKVERTRQIPQGADPSRFLAVIRFRDAGNVVWERDADGRLTEVTQELEG